MSGVSFSVPGCAAGALYSVAWVNTTTGDDIGTARRGAHEADGQASAKASVRMLELSYKCSAEGTLALVVPEFVQDIAAVVHRNSARALALAEPCIDA